MPILPVSNFRNYNVKPLSFNYTHNNLTQKSDKHVTTRDIPYSYPVAFKGRKQNREQILADSKWAKGIFEKYGIEAEIDEKDGLLTIEKFKEPYNHHTTYKKLRIDVARLIKNVKKIKGEGDFSNYKNLCIPNLEIVEGLVNCTGSRNIEFPKLKSAHDINCNNATNIKFSKLTTTNDVDCCDAKSIEFSKLKTANNIGCYFASDIKFSELTTTDYIDCRDAKSIEFSKLKTAGNIDCTLARNIKFPALITANDINCEHATSIKFPVLTTANDIYCDFARSIDFSALKNVNLINCSYAKSIKLPEQIIEKMNVPRERIAKN